MAQQRLGETRAWWLVAGLLIAAFLARGPLYLSVLPPFEGWDEYQHLGYIAYLDETGTIPVLGERTRVPLAIRPLVVSVPQSPSGADQLREWGASSYAEYWNAPGRAAGEATSSPRLYQAQHPPLAYALDLPLWRALKAPHGLEAIYAIRMMNLLIVAGALVLFAGALPRLVPAFGPRVAVLALVCLHPLFFQNVARVANDALAVATGVAGISLLVAADGRTLLTRGVLAAVCIAASIWSKQTGLTLLPALVVGVPLIGWGEGVSAGRLRRVTGIVTVTALLLVAPLWVWNYQHYGTMIAADESLQLAARGSVVSALAASFVNLDWRTVLALLFVPGRAWVGGWSYLPTHETLAGLYRWVYGGLVMTAAIGGAVALLRRRRLEPAIAVCAAAVVFTALGLMYHALVSYAVFGRPMTNPWYFMAALPFLFVLLVRGLESLHRRLATTAAFALAVLFVAIDLYGTWIQMPAFYTITTDTALQWTRLGALHPASLKGHSRWWLLAAQLLPLGLVAGTLVRARRTTAQKAA